MHFAILADIHGNLDSFEAVLKDLEKKGGFDKILCLGDIVGYGPEPNTCIELLRQFNHSCIAGNHDWAAIGNIDTMDFNEDAALANQWTTKQLTEEEKEYLHLLPQKITEGDFSMAHGSPREPIWEYLISTRLAEENLNYFTTPFCLVGHSHIPLIFEQSQNGMVLHRLEDGETIKLQKNRLIINPGSVGQPRDRDPRASYILYDSDVRTISHFRVDYDIDITQQKMVKLNLPEFLIYRLRHGI
jgi:diadenosine tetraphosphatase ApaH/serine/threonine PP2A family protein phosphatase